MPSLFKRAVGGLIGAGIGLLAGPFAMVGKLYADIEMDLLKIDYGIDIERKGAHFSLYMTALVVTPFAFAGGFLYGPVRGAMIGAELGPIKSILGVAKEMFTYDPDIHAATAERIPEKKCILNSYRIFHRSGVFLTDRQRAEKEELKQIDINARILAQGGRQKKSPLAVLPPELLAKIASFTNRSEVSERKKEQVINRTFSGRK